MLLKSKICFRVFLEKIIKLISKILIVGHIKSYGEISRYALYLNKNQWNKTL